MRFALTMLLHYLDFLGFVLLLLFAFCMMQFGWGLFSPGGEPDWPGVMALGW